MVFVAAASAWLLLGYGANRDQLDAIRTAGTLGVGFGGVVALWLAVRRQRSTELDLLQKYEAHQLAERIAAQNAAAADRAAAHAEHDARERRLTDLYLKAVEQLGADKPAVRHGGLYALERVAQDNPSQRQTVVDVICAYLRSPFTSPQSSGQARRLGGVRRPLLTMQVNRQQAKINRSATAPAESAMSPVEAQEEREVRLTAQRIVVRHLNPGLDPQHPVGTFWTNVRLDLTGATLIDFDFAGCRSNAAEFRGANFVGGAKFSGASFAGNIQFGGASFGGDAVFSGAGFAGNVQFGGASFGGNVQFRGVSFGGNVRFGGASFGGNAEFGGASFGGNAVFSGATFGGGAVFGRAIFASDAWFNYATFAGDAVFDGTSFAGDAVFDGAEFRYGFPNSLRA
jgi:uncharacterized protein YjbI with pentapeptide repeats